MRGLAELGFDVSVGVLHDGDTDATVAERLNLVRVTVPPFSLIDDRGLEDCAELARGASLIVVCDAPFGPANLGNLRLALEVARRGVRTLVLEQVPMAERDFTGGLATALWRALAERAAVFASSEALLDAARGSLRMAAAGEPST